MSLRQGRARKNPKKVFTSENDSNITLHATPGRTPVSPLLRKKIRNLGGRGYVGVVPSTNKRKVVVSSRQHHSKMGATITHSFDWIEVKNNRCDIRIRTASKMHAH